MKQGGFSKDLAGLHQRHGAEEGVVRLHHISTDEQITDICTKPLSGTSLAGMQMFPWGSVDDCSIVPIFQD
jgi:hypothetical protein